MKCKYPTVFNGGASGTPSPCGQCQHCRINKRRVLTHRIMLEAMQHRYNSFLTLTYDDDHLPDSFADEETGEVYAPLSVNPDDHRKFMYSFRQSWRRATGGKIRFVMVGEYGDKSQRPHYHYALFGFPSCRNFRKDYRSIRFEPCKCQYCRFVSDVWQKGHIMLGQLEKDSAQYIAGYTLKKLTRSTTEFEQNILRGRHPEFVRFSNRPGIAYQAVVDIVSHLTRYGEIRYDDLPKYLNHGLKKLPLGRYLMDKLSEFSVDVKEVDKVARYRKALFDMLRDTELPSQEAKIQLKAGHLAASLQILNEQYSRDLEVKHQLFSKEKKL